MSTWNLGANDVSEETRAFREKLASKGLFVGCLAKWCGLLGLQIVKSPLKQINCTDKQRILKTYKRDSMRHYIR